jgi:hypothetical protein
LKIGINSSFIITQFDDLLKPKFYIDKFNNLFEHFITYDTYRVKYEVESVNEYDLSEKLNLFINDFNKKLSDVNSEISNKKHYEIDDNFDNIEHVLHNAYDFDRNKSKNSNFVITNGFVKISDDMFLDKNNVRVFVYLLDLFLGIPSLFIDNDPSQIIRRLYYKSGDYTKYQNTIEYKLLSNDWMFDPSKIKFVYRIIDFCFNFLKEEKYEKFYEVADDFVYIYGYDFNEVIKIIDKLKLNDAEKYMRFISNFLPENLCKDLEKIKTS